MSDVPEHAVVQAMDWLAPFVNDDDVTEHFWHICDNTWQTCGCPYKERT